MYKIENLEQIWSVDLKRNIILLKEEICEFIFQNWNDPDLSKKVNTIPINPNITISNSKNIKIRS